MSTSDGVKRRYVLVSLAAGARSCAGGGVHFDSHLARASGWTPHIHSHPADLQPTRRSDARAGAPCGAYHIGQREGQSSLFSSAVASANTVAAFLGMSVSALRSWRSERSPSGSPVTRIDRMVLYSMKELERYIELRTVEGR